jgi:putative phosphoesterase
MRILVVSDIHSNWPALEAVSEPFDLCVCVGDLVDYGVEPIPCIDWVRKNAAHSVRGNHDHGSAQGVIVNGVSGFRYLTAVTRPVTCARLDETNRRFLARLPLAKYLTLDGKRYLVIHATPRDPMDEYAPADVDFWKRRLEGIDVDYVVCGHTHQPYILQVGNTKVINPGSVGLPRDGDPRAAYAVIENNTIELKRVEYPIERTIASVLASELPQKAKDMLVEVYRTGRLVNGKNGAGKPNGVAANGSVNIEAPAERELAETRVG